MVGDRAGRNTVILSDGIRPATVATRTAAEGVHPDRRGKVALGNGSTRRAGWTVQGFAGTFRRPVFPAHSDAIRVDVGDISEARFSAYCVISMA